MLKLRVLVGSYAYGLETPKSDKDYIEVYLEEPEQIYGLALTKTTQTITPDKDTTRYYLKDFVRLAYKGNPTILEVLWVPRENHDIWGYVYSELTNNRNLFLSKSVGYRYLGYAESQLVKMYNNTGLNITRQNLIDAYGYDTKYAMHCLRLVKQGIELIETHNIELPIKTELREYLIKVRQGQFSKEQIVTEIEKSMTSLEKALELSTLPDLPNLTDINNMLIGIYREEFDSTYGEDT